MQIEIKNLKVEACHGVHAEEKVNPQPFVFTVKIETDEVPFDDIQNTISYSDVMKFIVKYTNETCYDLIETLADRVAFEIIQKFERAKSVTVRLEKPNAPVPLTFETVAVTTKREKVTAYIALGSSLGDKKATLDGAIQMLKEKVTVKKVSSYLETEPYGGVAKETFLNGAVEIETYLTPYELLDFLHEVEQAYARTRDIHWGDRTLDLDILLYGNLCMESETLVIPHKEMEKRDFVLIPLAEISPYAYHPLARKTAKELLQELS